MRIVLRTRPLALWGALCLAASVLLMPLRLVLGVAGVGDDGLTARAVTGSVWRGALRDAAIGDAGLGDLAARLSPWGLLVGEVRVRLDSVSDGAGARVHATLVSDRHVLGLVDANAAVDVGALLNPLPVARLELAGVDVRFRDEACDTASGRVRAVLAASGGIPLPTALAGTLRCERGELVVPLSGGGARVVMRIGAGGRYRADFTLPTPDAATAARLAAAGFAAPAAPGGGWRLAVEGRL